MLEMLQLDYNGNCIKNLFIIPISQFIHESICQVPSDIPAIVDVDLDGDLDILTFHIGGSNVEYHQNQSMDLYGVPDSLIFEVRNRMLG